MSVGLVQVDSIEGISVEDELFKSDGDREEERKASAGMCLRMGDMVVPVIAIPTEI